MSTYKVTYNENIVHSIYKLINHKVVSLELSLSLMNDERFCIELNVWM